jgi:WD40 repeat protein
LCSLEEHVKGVRCLIVSKDDNRLFSGSFDATIKVWDTAANTCIATLQGHNDTVTALCLSLKTNILISASYDRTIRVWNTSGNTFIHRIIDAGGGGIYSLALSEDSDILYSDAELKDINLWRLNYQL